MSNRGLRSKDELVLTARAAGRCQFRGCNVLLTEDQLTRSRDNFGAFAHIVAHSPDGPRGDATRSHKLSRDVNNFLLLCLEHHKLIDGDNWHHYPEQLLLEMKAEHEARIERVTSQVGDQRTHLLLLDAHIGPRSAALTRQLAARAVLPLYADDATPVFLSTNRQRDGERLYWEASTVEVQRAVDRVQDLYGRREVGHVSVLALAPIPLLIWLGYRLGDIIPAECHQKRREVTSREEEAEGWRWVDEVDDLEFEIEAEEAGAMPHDAEATLVLAVSDAPGTDLPISGGPRVTLRATRPGVDVVRSRRAAAAFRHAARKAMQFLAGAARIHVVPIIPNSLAVEFGRLQLPKAHPPLVIYDRHDGREGRVPVLQLHGGEASVV